MTADGRYIATRAEEREVNDDNTRADNLSERATTPSEIEEGGDDVDEEEEDEDGPYEVVPINKPLFAHRNVGRG